MTLQPPAQRRTEKAILSDIFGRGGLVDQANEIITGSRYHKGGEGLS